MPVPFTAYSIHGQRGPLHGQFHLTLGLIGSKRRVLSSLQVAEMKRLDSWEDLWASDILLANMSQAASRRQSKQARREEIERELHFVCRRVALGEKLGETAEPKNRAREGRHSSVYGIALQQLCQCDPP